MLEQLMMEHLEYGLPELAAVSHILCLLRFNPDTLQVFERPVFVEDFKPWNWTI